MAAIDRCSVPLNHMTVADCLGVLGDDCDAESARQVAFVMRHVLAKWLAKDKSHLHYYRRTLLTTESHES